MNEIQYKNKKPDFEAVKKFGFEKIGEIYCCKKPILDGELEMQIHIDREGMIKYGVFDADSGDEYVLHTVSGAVGSYVGSVRQKESEILSQIYNECFENEMHSAGQIRDVLNCLVERFGETPKYPFGEETIVMRRADNDKWYALFMKIPAKKIGLEADEIIDVVNLKMKPEEVERVVDGKHYFAAYHMNKKHWVTIPLDTAVSTDELMLRIIESRILAGMSEKKNKCK